MPTLAQNNAQGFIQNLPRKTEPVSTGGLVVKSVSLQQLVRTFNLQNVRSLNQPANNYEGKINQTTVKDPELYKSALGTPVVIDLTFDSVTYKDFNTNQTKTTDKITFVTVLCTVTQPKKIVKTEIQGADGTVKEYIGLDDYQVSINGIITGANGQRPLSELLALKRMLDAPVPVPVISSFLNNLGIFNVVVNDYTLPQEAGGWSKQDFSINAISDTPLELLML